MNDGFTIVTTDLPQSHYSNHRFTVIFIVKWYKTWFFTFTRIKLFCCLCLCAAVCLCFVIESVSAVLLWMWLCVSTVSVFSTAERLCKYSFCLLFISVCVLRLFVYCRSCCEIKQKLLTGWCLAVVVWCVSGFILVFWLISRKQSNITSVFSL